MIRAVLLLLAAASLAPGWVEAVEFPWNSYPRELWERQLVWLRSIGATHVSLPPGNDDAALAEVIQIIRRLHLEADLEGPLPASMESLTTAHGGPLTPSPTGPAARISALGPDAVTHSRTLLGAGAPSLLWTDAADTFDSVGFHPGARSFAGAERASSVGLRRAMRLSRYWGASFPLLRESPGATMQVPAAGVTVRQFSAPDGASVVSVVNRSATAFAGDVRVSYPALKRSIVIPGLRVAANDALWLPVDVPLKDGLLCHDCVDFGTTDHLIYATVELTGMEYENGILAMEFYAPAAGEAVLQMSRQPTGPLVAGGRLSAFDWDERARRLRIPVPAGVGMGKQVRIGLAMEAPDATAFFDSAAALVIGEQNSLTAHFSSAEIANRSRLLTSPEFVFRQEASAGLPTLEYKITVPPGAVHGDTAELSIEADGRRISHANPGIVQAVQLQFPESINVRLAPDSRLPLFPATIPVNRRQGREVTVTVRNNAPAIRSFRVVMSAQGLEFSPAMHDLSIGASSSRDVTFRVFTADAAPGAHAGEVRITGSAFAVEPIRFLVVGTEDVRLSSNPFEILETARYRAVFTSGRWLEFLNKETGRDALPAGGITFDTSGVTSGSVKIEELAGLAPK